MKIDDAAKYMVGTLMLMVAGALLWVVGSSVFGGSPSPATNVQQQGKVESAYDELDRRDTDFRRQQDEAARYDAVYPDNDWGIDQLDRQIDIGREESQAKQKGSCVDVTSYDYNWNNDMLCTRPDGSTFYTDYAGAAEFEANYE